MDFQRLQTVRDKYNNLNSFSLHERLVRSSPIELWTIETLNYHGVCYNNMLIRDWRKCRTRDDKRFKRDAEAFVNDHYVYAQLKFRQPNSGTDIGCAIIQPYPGREVLRHMILTDRDQLKTVLARDFKFDGIVYACLNNSWEKLVILPFHEVVKPLYTAVLKEWLVDPTAPELASWNRTYSSSLHAGAQLKWKRDSGKRSFDSGEEKVICYLPASIFEEDPRVKVVDMIDPPDYVLK